MLRIYLLFRVLQLKPAKHQHHLDYMFHIVAHLLIAYQIGMRQIVLNINVISINDYIKSI